MIAEERRLCKYAVQLATTDDEKIEQLSISRENITRFYNALEDSRKMKANLSKQTDENDSI